MGPGPGGEMGRAQKETRAFWEGRGQTLNLCVLRVNFRISGKRAQESPN